MSRVARDSLALQVTSDRDGYRHRMFEARSGEELEAIQSVVDRVSSYQDGAPKSTVERELVAGLAEVGVQTSEDEVSRLANAIEAEHGSVDAASLLG